MDTEKDDLDDLLRQPNTGKRPPHALYTAVLLLVKWLADSALPAQEPEAHDDKKRARDTSLVSDRLE